MRYLQADTCACTLKILPSERNWNDHNVQRHYEYHLASFGLFHGKTFDIEIDAAAIPWAAILHCRLFARVILSAQERYERSITAVRVVDAGPAARMLHRFVLPLISKGMSAKVQFIERSQTVKKTA